MQKATQFGELSKANEIIAGKGILLGYMNNSQKQKKTFLHSPTVLEIVHTCCLELPFSLTDHYQKSIPTSVSAASSSVL